MTLLAVERIKLMSTRSPWWCSALAITLVAGFTAVVAAAWDEAETPLPFSATGSFLSFATVIVMVMAAVAVTTEYRFSTIRTTFQANPNRSAVLLAKTAVVALVGRAVGLTTAFTAWGVTRLVAPGADLAITTAAQWRAVAGFGLVCVVAAVLAVAVGILLRQTAGAVSVLLVWALAVEVLVPLIPNVGDDIHKWLPFTALGSGHEARRAGEHLKRPGHVQDLRGREGDDHDERISHRVPPGRTLDPRRGGRHRQLCVLAGTAAWSHAAPMTRQLPPGSLTTSRPGRLVALGTRHHSAAGRIWWL